MLSSRRKLLLCCLNAYEMEEDEAIGISLILNKEGKVDEMLEWMEHHTTATPEEVLRGALEILNLD